MEVDSQLEVDAGRAEREAEGEGAAKVARVTAEGSKASGSASGSKVVEPDASKNLPNERVWVVAEQVFF